jgi:hypothetical protein
MLSFAQVVCRMHIHHWHYETKGHAFKGFVYPVSYRSCKRCKLAQVKIMDVDSVEVVWQAIENNN